MIQQQRGTGLCLLPHVLFSLCIHTHTLTLWSVPNFVSLCFNFSPKCLSKLNANLISFLRCWEHFALVLGYQDKKLNPRKMGIKEEEEEGEKSSTRKRVGTEQTLHQRKPLPLVLELHRISFFQDVRRASPQRRNRARARPRAVHCPPGMLLPLRDGGGRPEQPS